MDNQKIDCLAIIGAGEAALPIINKAKSMNIQTIAFGRNDSFAKNSVDIFIEENSFNVDYICETCNQYQVNGVIASNELTTEVAAKVAHQLHLPGNKIDGGFAGKNKYLMRCRIQQLNSIKQPKFELYNERQEYTFPKVVKAVDSSGKRGITLVSNFYEFKSAIEIAKEYSSDRSALIEEYLEGGQEYSIECLSFNDQHSIVQYTEKESSGPPHFAEVGHHQPANLSDFKKNKINDAINEILTNLGIRCGMSHVELKIINEEVYFIEAGARAGGDHIADTLVPLSTNFDMYKAAIECCLGRFNTCNIKTVAYSGIYFHCKQNEALAPIFKAAQTAGWCFQNTITSQSYNDVSSNVEAVNSGFIIYCADSKITLQNCLDTTIGKPTELNAYPNAFQMIWNHYKEIGRNLSDEELKKGIEKSLNLGHVITIIEKHHILAFLLLYCNHIESLDGYVCNVYVLEKYRGLGYSVSIITKAFDICRDKGFKSVSLHVAEDNQRAIYVYEKMGFKTTGNVQYKLGNRELEMRYYL